MVYTVYDDTGLLCCISQDWPRAYGVLAKLCGECVGSPHLEVYPDRAFALVSDHE